MVFVYFFDVQCKVICDVGCMVGFNVEWLFNELMVVVLVYGIYQCEVEIKFFVVDLGGGMFDVLVFDFFEGVMEV